MVQVDENIIYVPLFIPSGKRVNIIYMLPFKY